MIRVTLFSTDRAEKQIFANIRDYNTLLEQRCKQNIINNIDFG